MKCTKSILGFIAGASIGAMAGILLAPDKGASTRKKIIDQTNDLRSTLNDWVTDFIQSMKGSDTAANNNNSAKAPDMNINTMG